MRLAGQFVEKLFYAVDPRMGLRTVMAAAAAQRGVEFFDKFFLFPGQMDRGFDLNPAQKVSGGSATHGFDASAAQSEQFSGLGFGRDFQFDFAFQGRDFEFAAEGRGRETDRHLAKQVRSLALENRMFLDMNLYIEIARACAFFTGFTFPLEPDPVTGVDTGRYFDRQGLVVVHPAAAMARTARVLDLLALPAAARTGLLDREKALLHAHISEPVTS